MGDSLLNLPENNAFRQMRNPLMLAKAKDQERRLPHYALANMEI